MLRLKLLATLPDKDFSACQIVCDKALVCEVTKYVAASKMKNQGENHLMGEPVCHRYIFFKSYGVIYMEVGFSGSLLPVI